MKSRYQREEAEAFVRSAGCPEHLALRLYTSRLIGRDPELVLHGGGNTSVKGTLRTLLGDEVECLWVKGSGSSLDKVTARDFPALDLSYLRRLVALESLTDEEMVNQLRTHLFDASAPNPSVEALLHAFLPHRFVDHSHADAVVTLTNQPDGEALIREALGPEVIVLPYIMPGFPLAKAVFEAYQAHQPKAGILLMQHGLFTFGDTARESYERHIELVDRCEQTIAARRRSIQTPDVAYGAERARTLAPRLRGAITKAAGVSLVVERRFGPEVLQACALPQAPALFETGPLTPDHVLRVKPWPLFLSAEAEDDTALAADLARAVARYQAYFETHRARSPQARALDAAPRVLLDRATGIWAFGKSKQEAMIAADIAEHTLTAKVAADAISGYRALPDGDLFDMEYWSLEQAKLGKTKPRPLEGRVVLITGAAGAIGRGIAEVCAEAGAQLFLTDRDEAGLAAAQAAFASIQVRGCVMDVTDRSSVERAFDCLLAEYGGVDVVVANAGLAHVASLESLEPGDFSRLLAVNAEGTLATIAAAARVFRAQGLGGNIILNSSKNVFAPGKDFGAYSASKAAAHQLAKVAAIELAPLGVRVNMLNPDAVFSHGEVPSGLWSLVGPSRAKSRGLEISELYEFYRERNLLKVPVTAREVGNAVLFFATNQTPTTGASLPIDGGLVEAFPR